MLYDLVMWWVAAFVVLSVTLALVIVAQTGVTKLRERRALRPQPRPVARVLVTRMAE